MISESVKTYTKLPGEQKVYQVDLSEFLVQYEELDGDTFDVCVFERRQALLRDAFALDGVQEISLTLVDDQSKRTTHVWPRPPGAKNLLLLVTYDDLIKREDMLIPGTKVWDRTKKVASVCVQGGENGKEYMLFWRFKTTSRRVEEEYAILRVVREIATPPGV